jgi:phosphatidylserine/phosphatidylglycerophosphate/cardiolipin synthase-like enzyme
MKACSLRSRPPPSVAWTSASCCLNARTTSSSGSPGFSYYDQSLPYGIRLFRYHRGFLHQKVMLIDDRLAAVGTANLDNRSFRLNFEITAFCTSHRFVSQIREMLRSQARRLHPSLLPLPRRTSEVPPMDVDSLTRQSSASSARRLPRRAAAFSSLCKYCTRSPAKDQ